MAQDPRNPILGGICYCWRGFALHFVEKSKIISYISIVCADYLPNSINKFSKYSKRILVKYLAGVLPVCLQHSEAQKELFLKHFP